MVIQLNKLDNWTKVQFQYTRVNRALKVRGQINYLIMQIQFLKPLEKGK